MMVNTGRISVKAMSHSTLWIAVLVVHVGCIIEAQPSKYPSSSLFTPSEEEQLVPAASQSAHYTTSAGKNSIREKESILQRTFTRGVNRARKYSIISTSSTPTMITSTTNNPSIDVSDDDSSCSHKNDGYYQNWASDCTSYYFCAAGYQLTYVCPPGQRFNGKRCDDDFKCPTKPGHINPCGKKANGYYAYPGGRKPGKYFYCFQKAKVIELQCESGKVFIFGKCSQQLHPQLVNNGEQVAVVIDDTALSKIPPKSDYDRNSTSLENSKQINEEEACSAKSNGFYTERRSRCTKYYYCINEEKTGLNCQPGLVFNGDLCVHTSRFECPYDDDGNLVVPEDTK